MFVGLKHATSLYGPNCASVPLVWSTKIAKAQESPPPSARAIHTAACAVGSQFVCSQATAGSFAAIAVIVPVIRNGGPICVLIAVVLTVPTWLPPAGAFNLKPVG